MKIGQTSIISLFVYVLNVLAGKPSYISKFWYIQISLNSDTSWYLFLCPYIIPISDVWAVDDMFVECLRYFVKYNDTHFLGLWLPTLWYEFNWYPFYLDTFNCKLYYQCNFDFLPSQMGEKFERKKLRFKMSTVCLIYKC